MSARERSRYITVGVVFSLTFFVLGALIVRSARVMAQDYTFRPSVATANTYDGGVMATQRLNFALDQNINTAATTYTNADFSGDGATPDVSFEFSGEWSIFQQSTTFIRQIGLYIIRQGIGNSLNQWRIQYTLYGAGAADGDWVTLEDGSSTPNPTKGTITTGLPLGTDVENDLAVRTMSRQENAIDAILNIYDIRVEAEWNPLTGGTYPLQIDPPLTLPDGVKDEVYSTSTITASGGNPYPGNLYDWDMTSGALPAGLSWSPSLPAQSTTIQLSGTPTEAGEFTFTIQVSDDSGPGVTQYDQVQYTINIAGLTINPGGPDLVNWDPMVLGASGGQTFLPVGGTSPYDWCLVSGTIPPGLSWTPSLPTCASAVAAANLYLSGTPTDAGTYAFTIRLADSSVNQEPVDHYYLAQVRSNYVTILKRLLRPMIKGIAYGTGATQMTPQYLRAINVVDSVYSTDVSWSATGLPAGLSLVGTTFDSIAKTSSVYIGGTIGVGTDSGTYNFTATINDNSVHSDTENFELEVLERGTVLRSTPPSAVALPANHTLNFLVSGLGGVPSESDDSALDPNSISYYTYYWEVTPVGDSPALGTASGTAVGLAPNPPYEPGPLNISILFEASGGAAVIGTYDVTFWAQDYLRRNNMSDPDYEFVPATTRIQIVSPAGRTLEKDTNRPTLLRQEQFR